MLGRLLREGKYFNEYNFKANILINSSSGKKNRFSSMTCVIRLDQIILKGLLALLFHNIWATLLIWGRFFQWYLCNVDLSLIFEFFQAMRKYFCVTTVLSSKVHVEF
jgi:hypothetical protein